MTKKIKVILSKVAAVSLVLSLVSFSNPATISNVNAATTSTPSFYDNFEDGNSSGWTIQKGSWAVKADGNNKTYNKTGTTEGRTKTGNLSWSNYAVEGKIKVNDFNGSNRAMLCGRYTDGSNYYAASLSNTNSGEIQLRKMVSGKDSILKTVNLPLSTSTWYTVKLDMNGNNLSVYLNGDLKLTASDNSIAAGAIGLVAYNATTQYDDISVTANDTPTPVTYPTPTLTPNTTAANVSSVTVTIDNFGSAPLKQYKLDDGAWQSYTSPVTVTKNCTVYAQGSDTNGNKSSIGKLVISNIGTAPITYPTPTLVPNTTAANVSSVTVTIDNFGSAPLKQYKLDDGAWQSYTSPVTVTKNCTVYAQGSDTNGNKSSIGKLVISNIGTAPITYPTPTLVPNTTAANVSSVTITIDNFGSAPLKQYKLDDGAWQSYTSPVTVTKNCTVYAQGSDTNGNKSSIGSLVISNVGSVTPPGDVITVKTFDELKAKAAAASNGQTIEIAANTLDCTSQLVLDKVDSNITIKAAAGYTPILDFSSFRETAKKESPSKTGDGYAGIRVYGGSYTIKGLIIQKAYDNGMLIKPFFDPNVPASKVVTGKPDNNKIIDCVFRYNGDSGLQISGSQTLEEGGVHVRPNNNHIIGCVSYRNYDPLTSGGNADGFAAKLYLGKGTVFTNCVAAENSDDGWDSFGIADSDVTYENCIAFHSGDPAIFTGEYDKAKGLPQDTDMTTGKPSGNANGFKMGSGSSKYGAQTSGIKTFTNCIAIDNFAKGFDENNGAGTINITNGMGLGNVKCDYLLDLMKAGTFVNAQAFSAKGLKNPVGGTVSIVDTSKQAAIRTEIETALAKMRQELRSNKIPSYMNFSFWTQTVNKPAVKTSSFITNTEENYAANESSILNGATDAFMTLKDRGAFYAEEPSTAEFSSVAGNFAPSESVAAAAVSASSTKYPTPKLKASTTAANVSSVTVTISNFGKATIKQYKIDNNSWQDYTSPIAITNNCTVYAQGSDASGNKSSIGSLVISNIASAPSEVRDYDLYVSPSSGNDANKGTVETPLKTLSFAASVVKPGRTIYLRGGVHKYSSTILLSRSGSQGAPINIYAYAGEKPVLDFSDFKPADENTRFYARGITLTGDYYHIKGIEICNAPDNGMKLEGSNNTIEQCVFHHNGDSGLQIGLIKGATNDGTKVSNNLILNCDSYRNADPATKYENADGFACKLYPGKGNKFYGCRSYENCDDGWDFYMTTYPITVENCWAWHNGDPSLWGFTTFNGDGNGFKLGGDGEAAPHIIKNCVAFDSPYGAKCGFNDNNNGTGLILYNCTAWACGKNFKLQTQAHVLKNCAAFDPKSGKNFNADLSPKATSVNNTWDLKNITADYNDFISTNVNDAKAAREADGSLPNNGFAKLKADSDLIDKGVDVGIPYKGTAPDLGAYECK